MRTWLMERQTCSFRFLGPRPATFGWYKEYKACPLVPLLLLTPYSKSSWCLNQAPNSTNTVNNWTDTSFMRLLCVKYPLIRGPFRRGSSSVQLTSTVSKAGGLYFHSWFVKLKRFLIQDSFRTLPYKKWIPSTKIVCSITRSWIIFYKTIFYF